MLKKLRPFEMCSVKHVGPNAYEANEPLEDVVEDLVSDKIQSKPSIWVTVSSSNYFLYQGSKEKKVLLFSVK